MRIQVQLEPACPLEARLESVAGELGCGRRELLEQVIQQWIDEDSGAVERAIARVQAQPFARRLNVRWGRVALSCGLDVICVAVGVVVLGLVLAMLDHYGVFGPQGLHVGGGALALGSLATGRLFLGLSDWEGV